MKRLSKIKPKQRPKLWIFPTPLNLLKTQMFYIHRDVTTPPHPVVVVVTSRCGVCVVSGVGG